MQSIGIGAGLAVLGFWAFVAIVAVAAIWDGARKREAQHETLRRMLDRGQPIDPVLMERLLAPGEVGPRHPDHDLQVGGLVVLSVALGLALLGGFLGRQSPPWLLPILGVAALVGCIGGGLLVAAFVSRRWQREGGAAASHRHPV